MHAVPWQAHLVHAMPWQTHLVHVNLISPVMVLKENSMTVISGSVVVRASTNYPKLEASSGSIVAEQFSYNPEVHGSCPASVAIKTAKRVPLPNIIKLLQT